MVVMRRARPRTTDVNRSADASSTEGQRGLAFPGPGRLLVTVIGGGARAGGGGGGGG
jgi:hypothetical protein